MVRLRDLAASAFGRSARLAGIALIVSALLLPVVARAAQPGGGGASWRASAMSASRWRFNRSERCFMRKINDKRARHGRRRLGWDKQVGYVARRHARKMARYRDVFHDGNLGREITRWRALGQNSGKGGRCARLFRAFWRSRYHRSNILGRWRFMGVGTRWRNGRLYAQQVFERRRNPGNVYRYP